MKKSIQSCLILIVFLSFVVGFGYKKDIEPNQYYQVYLNEKVIGIIKSKKALEEYIDKKGNDIKNKYHVNKIYEPEGLEIKKINTYSNNVSSVKSIYNKIQAKESFTIKGYQFRIRQGKKSQKIYVVNKSTFNTAVDTLIQTFVGKSEYKNYNNHQQQEIQTTGSKIENIYIDNDITVVKKKIPVTNEIYTNSTTLSKYLLFGKDQIKSTYLVQAGDTLSKVALNNKISVEELLISNTKLNSSNNLLFSGQELTIAQTNPQLNVVTETYAIEDLESEYNTEEKYNDNMIQGDSKVIQEGQNGLERVTQRVKKINGNITYVQPINKEVLKPLTPKIVEVGNKVVSGVGSTTSWLWPSESGWTLSSEYGWRTWGNGSREFHEGLDISGTGYGSKIYASNNGVVYQANYRSDYGNNVVINHNNGYYTLYGHMSRIADGIKTGVTVERGQVIGYVGSTGQATGPHIHFEVWQRCQYCRINPWSLFR